ncbi:hypothetical protein CPter91_2261 [Collimonas pratensis]|uniref:Uncharacterized protein n=1 Tax=Collimonas pratensis TaxID=279113 RepID=A0A127Q464_9BURK|nr:hypothetical protein CPter91_2261 [Collimonas pratensis]
MPAACALWLNNKAASNGPAALQAKKNSPGNFTALLLAVLRSIAGRMDILRLEKHGNGSLLCAVPLYF